MDSETPHFEYHLAHQAAAETPEQFWITTHDAYQAPGGAYNFWYGYGDPRGATKEVEISLRTAFAEGGLEESVRVANLSEREQAVLIGRLSASPRTLQDIGEEWGCGVQRVRQVRARGLASFLEFLETNAGYLPDGELRERVARIHEAKLYHAAKIYDVLFQLTENKGPPTLNVLRDTFIHQRRQPGSQVSLTSNNIWYEKGIFISSLLLLRDAGLVSYHAETDQIRTT